MLQKISLLVRSMFGSYFYIGIWKIDTIPKIPRKKKLTKNRSFDRLPD